jgi:hypothetical protein
VTRLKWTLVSVHLEIVLFLSQDRGMICAENHYELLGEVGLVESYFSPYGDGVSVGVR